MYRCPVQVHASVRACVCMGMCAMRLSSACRYITKASSGDSPRRGDIRLDPRSHECSE